MNPWTALDSTSIAEIIGKHLLGRWLDKAARLPEPLRPTSATLLHLMALLAPAPIPVALFVEGEKTVRRAVALLSSDTGQENDWSPIPEALAELHGRFLISFRETTLTIRPEIQEAVRSYISWERRRDWLDLLLQLVNGCSPELPSDPRTWPAWELLRPHAAAVLDSLEDSTPVALLAGQLGAFLWAKGLHEEAEPLMRRALALDEDTFGSEHPRIAIRLNNLALVLMGRERFSEAEPLLGRALSIDEACSGSTHPSVARDLNNLAQLLQNTGCLFEAELMEEIAGPSAPPVGDRLAGG